MVKRSIQVIIHYLQKNPHTLLLVTILGLALFFRAYKLIERFEFAHDGDLYSWIVKDIVVTHHPRLIGQLTTAPGIFIGPAFYYMLIPFFLLTRMDPVGAVIPITIIGIATVASYYWVFARLFNKEVGLITSFLYAVLLSPVTLDRRVVPSTPTNVWLIWYFYSIIMVARGKYQILPLVGFLTGLIWHIHIALAPALVVFPVAMLLARKIPSPKLVLLSFFAFSLPSIPLVLFEFKHGFSQTTSLLHNFSVDYGGGTGIPKLNLVITMITKNIDRLFFYPQTLPFINHTLFVIILLAVAIFLVRKKLLSWKEVVLFYFWIGIIVLYYSVSSTIISEYYFANIEVIFLTIVSLLLFLLYKSSTKGRVLVILLLLIVAAKNIGHVITLDFYKKGYNERKAVAEYITQDAKQNGFPCVGISYITSAGENVGFRYFFWLNNLKTNYPQSGTPNYTIVLPDELAPETIVARFGHMGIILPDHIPGKTVLETACSGQNTNLTDPMFGFTN